VVDHIVSGRSAAYRKASEALHGAAPSWDRRATHYRVLWECGYGDLIRADFYRLFAFPAGVSGDLLDAGCGTGIEAVNLHRQAPGLRIQGVDVSSVALAGAVAKPETGKAAFYQAALERLPFPAAVFDYIASHEVIEHVEDPAVGARARAGAEARWNLRNRHPQWRQLVDRSSAAAGDAALRPARRPDRGRPHETARVLAAPIRSRRVRRRAPDL
jgi:SAM-dependent methyltransferase